jgi:hypothetical protein
MDRAVLARAARAEMESLGETARTVMEMCDVDGFTPIEVAEAIGLTNGNVRVILHRARATVRQRLEERFARGLSSDGASLEQPEPPAAGPRTLARFEARDPGHRRVPWAAAAVFAIRRLVVAVAGGGPVALAGPGRWQSC